jgi:adenylate kinase family enzyme
MRIAIVGNSGSGKSTLARNIAGDRGVPILDLDIIFWQRDKIAVPRPFAQALVDLNRFCRDNRQWVIEGCYGDLVRAALAFRPTLIFLDPGMQACLDHCRARPWEPHKYKSKAQQDAQLDVLLPWVAAYYERDGDTSLRGHRRLFDDYDGPKERVAG